MQALFVSPDLLGMSSRVLMQFLTAYLVLSASESDRMRRVAGVALLCTAALLMAAILLGQKSESDGILFGLLLVNILLHADAPVVITRHIFFRQVVDRQTYIGALCAYFMIGIFFAFTIGAVDVILDEPFFTSGWAKPMSDYLFLLLRHHDHNRLWRLPALRPESVKKPQGNCSGKKLHGSCCPPWRRSD